MRFLGIQGSMLAVNLKCTEEVHHPHPLYRLASEAVDWVEKKWHLYHCETKNNVIMLCALVDGYRLSDFVMMPLTGI